MKTCAKCKNEKPEDQFSKKKKAGDGLNWSCKECNNLYNVSYRLRKGICVNEARFKSLLNGISSIARKTLDAIPEDVYWSQTRIHNELCRAGTKTDPKILGGVLNTLVKSGLITEVDRGMFSRATVTLKKAIKKEQEQIVIAQQENKPKQEEVAMTNKQPANPFDELREVAIKFFDIAKTINGLASEIDQKLIDVEKHMAANEQDTAKLKQLQTLLKSLG